MIRSTDDVRLPQPRAHDQSLWVIFQNPADYPGQVVARRIDAMQRPPKYLPEWLPTPIRKTFASVEAAREELRHGRSRIERHPDDDAAVMEIWK